MLSQMNKYRKYGGFSFFALSFLLMTAFALGVWGMTSVAEAAPLEPSTVPVANLNPTVQDEGTEDVTLPVAVNEDVKVLLEEMTLVHLLWEQYGYAKTACAGNGLNNIQPSLDGPKVLIPNAGDLSVGGSTVAIKLSPDGEISFIPRVPGQRIRIPMDLNSKLEGEEVLNLTFAEAKQLMAADELVWTAKDQGPFGNGHGLPGHIAACDPQFDEEVFEDFNTL
jgi:hypothetical protein